MPGLDFINLGSQLNKVLGEYQDHYNREDADHRERAKKGLEREAALKAEVEQLRAENAELRRVVETMESHPDVKARKVREAQEALRAAQIRVEKLSKE